MVQCALSWSGIAGARGPWCFLQPASLPASAIRNAVAAGMARQGPVALSLCTVHSAPEVGDGSIQRPDAVVTLLVADLDRYSLGRNAGIGAPLCLPWPFEAVRVLA